MTRYILIVLTCNAHAHGDFCVAQQDIVDCGREVTKVLSAIRTQNTSSTALVASLEQQIIQESADRQRLEASLKAAEVLLTANMLELQKTKAAMDADNERNMSLFGKMAVDNKAYEEKVESLSKELAASSERCASLRAMNEELLQMLEQTVPADA